MRPLQSEVEQRGARIFEIVDQHPESLFSKAGFYQRMMALSMRDEQFKAQLFRFVDVLPSLRKSGDIVEHLEEYFADMRNVASICWRPSRAKHEAGRIRSAEIPSFSRL